jgi:hypothetical protein
MNGVTVSEKIIPDGTLWKDDAKAKKAGFDGAGSLYKKNQKLSGGTGKPKWVTIHNTDDLTNVDDDGEQYTRATYNENMGSARVHFYVDDTGAWQNLKAGTGLCSNDPEESAEVSWHAGDGSVADGGNMTSISIEIIMNDTSEHDAKAYDNGARIAAWMLWKHGLSIERLVTHTYWVNKSSGNSFDDVDEQCTNFVSGKKWCPTYIFKSTNHATALTNWKTFKSVVTKYLDALNGNVANAEASTETEAKVLTTSASSVTFAVGDKVRCKSGVTKYSDGTKMASWVSTATLYVRAVESNGKILLVSTYPVKKVYTGRVNASDMNKI